MPVGMDYLTFGPPCISVPVILKRWPPERLLSNILFLEATMVATISGMKRFAEWNGSSRPAKLRRHVSFALSCSDASV